MPWYSYLFFALALIVFIFGIPAAVHNRNTHGMVHALLLLALWLGLGLWTGGFFG